MKNVKTPGSDGYSADFFLFFWNDLQSINLSKTVLNLLATTPDAILYTVFRRDIGLQFCNR
jgi:hypothetical protein